MIKQEDKKAVRRARHQRMRNGLEGTAERPRMCVYRSLNNIYVQIIDDKKQRTLVAASTLDAEVKAKLDEVNKSQAAKLVGEIAGKRALNAGISKVVFDRGGYLYTGRVAQVAAGAREAGLDF
ncbi:MAG: 50S ribosomal protein L18 [Christensenellales bacterium]